uniref:carbohydrate kinase family protein n=1 Tax=Halomonas sp. TaxID=1486246 RepID=UPI0026201F78|nr:carbohydrate kinase [Halomonas sp.]
MTPVIAFGEALVDMLSNRLGNAVEGPETFTPYAGGAPANVAVACARLGLSSHFLGMIGDDYFGRFLEQELSLHGVDISGVVRTHEARTALAFVSRDEHGERTFDFYRPPAADLLYRVDHLPVGIFAQPAIVHMCSNSLTDPDIADTTLTIAEMAKRANSLVSVDANLRHNLWEGHKVDTGLVTRLIDLAQLVKLSSEELDTLRGDHPREDWLAERLTAGARLIVITDGPGSIAAYTANGVTHMTPPKVKAVDTTAGGDAFIGGLLAALAEHNWQQDGWQHDTAFLNQALTLACRCGAHAVTRPGAYSALPTRNDVMN